jgi:DNA primase
VKTEHARRIYFEQLRRVVSLSMVLARYNIELRRQGQQLVGPCPIHGGSDRRQFVVKPTTSEWHCFGDCKRGGAMLEFVAAKENVDIVEAARLIARWFAIGTGDQPHSRNSEGVR